MTSNFYDFEPYYDRYSAKLCELADTYPNLRKCSIGKSVLGRDIYAVSLGNTENAVLFAGGFHAQEWLTCSLLTRFIEYAADCSELLEQRGLVVVPMVNPDGIAIALEGVWSAHELAEEVLEIMQSSDKSWQANANGVDLNHNYDAGFAELKQIERAALITAPSPRRYGGEYAHSEPETRAMVNFLARHQIETAYAFHSQGEEIFYKYGIHTPKESYAMAQKLADLSGYSLVLNDGLCSHGGFKDYFIDKYHRPAFTIEIGKGENPLPITMLNGIYERLLPMLNVALTL